MKELMLLLKVYLLFTMCRTGRIFKPTDTYFQTSDVPSVAIRSGLRAYTRSTCYEFRTDLRDKGLCLQAQPTSQIDRYFEVMSHLYRIPPIKRLFSIGV